MKNQTGDAWKGILRWVRLALSIGILMVGFTIACLWACLLLHVTFFRDWTSNTDGYFGSMLFLAATVGLISGLVLGVVGRRTIWITVLTAFAALGLCAFVPQFWAATYQKTSGFIGERFIAELCRKREGYSGKNEEADKVAAAIVMVYDAKCGRHCSNDSHAPPKK